MKKLAYLILLIPFILGSCNRDPIADFFISRNVVDMGDVVYFTNNSLDADYFEWDFGDGARAEGYDVNHIYDQEGVYYVTLFAYHGWHRVDKAVKTVTVRFPTSLKVIVLEYYEEYPVEDASVLLYNTLDDWNNEYNPLVEGFTNHYGETEFSHLNEQRYYIDVWETNHHNYWLAEEDVGFIETDVLYPNELNSFIAWVDYTGPELKSSGERDRSIARVRKLERVDRRTYEEKLESVKKILKERELNEEQPENLDETR
jgi:hypothetical protein